MAAVSAFSLLNLPFELRNQIYSQLLCPTVDEAITLYCAPDGRPSTLNIHPNILLTNKLIYDEALSLLYANTYRIDLTSPTPSYTCCGPWAPDAPDIFIAPDVQYLESTRDWCFTKKGELLSTKGKIYPYIFKRLRHVEIQTEDCAVWSWSMCGAFWSRGGDLVVEILRCLSEIDEKEEQDKGTTVQTLGSNFTVLQDRDGNHLFGHNREREGILGEMKAMLSLLPVIKKRRTVMVKAELLSRDHGRLGDIDLERWVGGLGS